MVDDWERITPLEFKSSFAHIWRNQHSEWCCLFADHDSEITLRVETLKDAISTAENMFLEKKYKQPKAKKIVKPAKERAARKKKTEVAEPKKKKFPRKTTKKKRKNVNSTKKGK